LAPFAVVQAAAEEAGVTCKLTIGRDAIASWTFDSDGRVHVSGGLQCVQPWLRCMTLYPHLCAQDNAGVLVANVWKTFNWNTIIGVSAC
jgi:hypothetical protein